MSIKNQLLIGFILLLGGFVKAQIPQSISIEKSTNGQRAQLACVPGQENFAGTVSLGAIVAQSNDIDLDTMFLCVNDTVGIVHNGDQILTHSYCKNYNVSLDVDDICDMYDNI